MIIYGLFDPRNQELRYVGFTSKTIEERLNSGHLSASSLKKKNHKNSWIKSLLNQNLMPEIKVIKETNEKDWQKDERENIEYFKSIGCRLTNIAQGGRGTIGFKHTPEAKKKIGEAAKGNQYALGIKATDETKKKMSDTRKRLGIKPNPTPEQRKIASLKTAEKLRGRKRPDWVIQKIRVATTGKIVSAQTKKLLSEINRKFNQEQIDKIFNEYICNNISLLGLAKKYNVVPSVMFNILHEIKYKCSNPNVAKLAKEKLNIRSRRPKGLNQ